MKSRTVRATARRMQRTWRRLRATGFDTRVSRGQLADALGVPEQGLSAVMRDIRGALGGRLPVGPHDAPAIARALKSGAPDEIERTCLAADRVARRSFDLLGSGPVDLGTPIDWQRDFKSGHRWDAAAHYTRVRFEQAGCDIKVPWELSRGQHLPLLAQAYLLSGRHDYASAAVDQVREWIAGNPPEYGVNWACPMDAAIRVVNWLWMSALLADAPACNEQFFEEFIASLWAHGTYLAGNLEIPPDDRRTNHLIADLVGLLYLGVCVPELSEATAWVDLARAGLTQEMSRQVLPDGVNYESSTGYHRLVTELFLSSAILAKRHGRDFPDEFLARLEKMIDFVAAYTKPNGLAPQIGDADDGRLHVLSGYGTADVRDHRHLLAAGAVLFPRPDWRRLAGNRWTEALWFGDARPQDNEVAGVPEVASAAFANGGVYLLRAGSDMVVFTAGEVGTSGLGNHKHNDLLALEVQLDGEDILLDPGSYLYASDPSARNAFRSTRAHSTVEIDGVEQNRIPSGSLFSMHADATPRLIAWDPAASGGAVTAEHDGYTRLPSPVVHRRTARLERPHRVAIRDEFVEPAGAAHGEHDFLWTFAFAPHCSVERQSAEWLITTPGRRRFKLTSPRGADAQPMNVEHREEEGFASPRYGAREPTRVVRWAWRGHLPLTVDFEMTSYDA